MQRLSGPGAQTRRVGLAVILALSLLGVMVVPPSAQAAPTWGDAGVVVRGVATIPDGMVAWRLVQDVAELPGQAIFEQRALGFAIPLPVGDPLLLTDEATGAAYRIDGDDAAFVPNGMFQKRESLGDGAATYLRLALVPVAEVEDAGGDRLLFAGPPFAAPAGSQQLTLLRAALQAGESITVTGAAGETFVLVEQGSAVVSGKLGDETLTTVVGGGTSYGVGTFAGDLVIVGNRDATHVLAAVIGDPV